MTRLGRNRRGFTLVELMVSLGIFALVGTMLVAVLLAATRLFRAAESARAASDGAASVLAILREDLAQAVPISDGGWIHARLTESNGNGVMAWLRTTSTPWQVNDKGIGGQTLVVWWVHRTGKLYRQTFALGGGYDHPVFQSLRRQVRLVSATDHRVPPDPLINNNGTSVNQIASGVLRFSPWLAWINRPVVAAGQNGAGQPNWEALDAGGSILGPWADQDYDTDPRRANVNPDQIAPAPVAVRLVLTLAGGGTLIRDNNGTISLDSSDAGSRDLDKIMVLGGDTENNANALTLRTRGGPLPIGVGASFRIGEEWLAVDKLVRPGEALVKRGLHRSTAATIPRLAPVLLGQTHTVIWRFP